MYIFVSLCCKPSVIYYTNWLSKITYLLSHPHRFTGVIKIVISKQETQCMGGQISYLLLNIYFIRVFTARDCEIYLNTRNGNLYR